MTGECSHVKTVNRVLLLAFYIQCAEQGVETVAFPTLIIDLECLGVLSRTECGGPVSRFKVIPVYGSIAYQTYLPFVRGRPAHVCLVIQE